jgi:hypothetical protein
MLSDRDIVREGDEYDTVDWNPVPSPEIGMKLKYCRGIAGWQYRRPIKSSLPESKSIAHQGS